MKNVENYGIGKSGLERGYEDTGAIPEIGENIFKPEHVEMEKMHAKFVKEFGCCNHEETEKEGFLERNNYNDRI